MPETKELNGAVDLSKGLTADEQIWLATLLSHQNVCALLQTTTDKQMAAAIQAKLEPQETAEGT